jgi:nicotinamide riboside transporter PnuC
MENLLFLGYTAALFSLVGIVFNAQKKMACWPVWLISNIMWITYSVIEGDMPSILLWITFSIFNIYGWVQWKKDLQRKNGERGWPNEK